MCHSISHLRLSIKPKMIKKKKIIFFIWLFIILGILSFYFLNPEFFAAEHIKTFFSDNMYYALVVYLFLGVIRGFVLLPSTPLVLAGMLVFDPLLLFLVNLICIFASSTLVYYRGQYLGFDEFFNKNYPKQLAKLKLALDKKELPIIILWGFFPFVPTDMICYACEITNIKLSKCLIGVAIGESIICAIYIRGGASILNIFI